MGLVTAATRLAFGRGAAALSGATIDDGSVLGFRTVVTGAIPNNSVAAGAPARVVRRDIAWERPHLSRATPFYEPDASAIRRSRTGRSPAPPSTLASAAASAASAAPSAAPSGTTSVPGCAATSRGGVTAALARSRLLRGVLQLLLRRG